MNPLTAQVLTLLKYQAELVVLAVHRKPLEVDLASLLHNAGCVKTSFMFAPDDITEAISILSTHHKITDEIVSHKVPLADAVEAFKIADDASQSLKVMLVR